LKKTKKSSCLVKKIKSAFKGLKSLKIAKKKKKQKQKQNKTFGKSLKMKLLPKSSF
jgi:hypothetical protein